MQIICIKNASTTPKVVNTLETIMNHCGYFFRWESELNQNNDNSLILQYCDVEDSNSDHKIMQIPMLLHPDKINSKISDWDTYSVNEQKLPLIKGTLPTEQSERIYNFDILSNLFYHLNRIEEGEFIHPDNIDLTASWSVLKINDNFLTPVVDLLIKDFANWIEKQAAKQNISLIKKAPYPEGQEFGLALTHDIDFIRAYHPLKKSALKWLAFLKKDRDKIVSKIEQRDQDTWGFDKLLPFYKQKSWPATFLFIAKKYEGLHQRYNILSKRMRKVIKQIVSDNHEVALHCSRFAFEHPQRYLKEKQKLEKVAGKKITGMRHHYLRGLFPALWETAGKLNLDYDTTLCHRRNSGFRAGTGKPYFVLTESGKILEIPTLFFENTLPEEGMNAQEAIKEIRLLIKIVKENNGLLTTLWHSNNLNYPQAYKTIWENFIQLIEDEKPYIQTLYNHSQWIQSRNSIQIKSIKQADQTTKISFSIPNECSNFTLELNHQNLNINSISNGFKYQQTGKLVKIENPEKLKELELILS